MNRNFLVTGGARGIGRAICKHSLRQGGKVYFTDINEEEGTQTKKELQEEFGSNCVEFSVHDVTDQDDWDKVWIRAEEFFQGSVEALVNNAGVYGVKESLDMNIIDVNIKGTVLGTELGLQRMAKHGGVIVQLGSTASLVASSASPLYTASKHAVLGMIRAHDENSYKRTKVRMVGLCPSLVDTPLIRKALKKENGEDLSSEYGMRALKPDEVAEAFQQLVVSGESGKILMVYPGLLFYWPDFQMMMFKLFCFLSKICIKVRIEKSYN